MRMIEIEYPDFIPAVLNQSNETFEQEARFAQAVKLFEMGRLTSGQAARMAKVSRVRFLLECNRYGASSVQWDQEEINAEFSE